MKITTQVAIGALWASGCVVTLMAQDAIHDAEVMTWDQGEVLQDQHGARGVVQ